jgi:hypothetical protein
MQSGSCRRDNRALKPFIPPESIIFSHSSMRFALYGGVLSLFNLRWKSFDIAKIHHHTLLCTSLFYIRGIFLLNFFYYINNFLTPCAFNTSSPGIVKNHESWMLCASTCYAEFSF